MMKTGTLGWLGVSVALLLGVRLQAQTEDPRLGTFRAALADQFIVNTNGGLRKADLISMVNRHLMDSAAGNQATQPYMRLQVPAHPLHEEDPATNSVGVFRLRPDEAVVYVGPTPPVCDYFSFVTFLFVRFANSALPKGDWLFTSVRDPLNHRLLQTEGGPGRPFATNTMVIFTADQTTYQYVTDCAQQAGYPASMLNVYVLPAAELYMGVELDQKPDTFVIAIRSANIANRAESERYLNNEHYGAVYRLTPKTERALNAIPPPAWRNREATDEWVLLAQQAPGWNVTNALDQLEDAILGTIPHVEAKAFRSTQWFYDSEEVMRDDPDSPAYRKFDAGESSDTPYLRSATEAGVATNFNVGRDDIVVVYGVNHAASGLASYANFALYGDWIVSQCDAQPPDPAWYPIGCGNRIWNGVVGLNNRDYAGSAAQFLPTDTFATNFLYAALIVRGSITAQHTPAGLVLHWSYGTLEAADSVVGPWQAVQDAAAPQYTVPPNMACQFYRVRLPAFCVPLPNPPDPLPTPFLLADSIPFDYPAFVGYRAYLNPATDSGPSYNNIIPDRALWLKLR